MQGESDSNLNLPYWERAYTNLVSYAGLLKHNIFSLDLIGDQLHKAAAVKRTRLGEGS